MIDNPLLQQAFELFDQANSLDPRRIECGGETYPLELFFSQRRCDWVSSLQPDASAALLLAARSQHLRRWEIPRSTYPLGRPGYLKWRTELKSFHAQHSEEVLRSVGFSEQVIERVRQLNLKKDLGKDTECQVLEDALCLVFLEYQFDDLIAETEETTMVEIVRKTWAKMSEKAHQAALGLPLSDTAKSIVAKALAA